MPQTTLVRPVSVSAERLRSYIAIMRLDHAVKQLFVLPGIAVAMVLDQIHLSLYLLLQTSLGMMAVTLIASSNYVLNEMLDAPFDGLHPTKRLRPAARGAIHAPIGYAQWLALAVLGFLLADGVSTGVFVSCVALWGMGCIYNISPIRSKDVPYLDVTSEAINNPIRFCAGWYMVTSLILPPVSLLIAYWMLGSYFMALKRFSEYRQIGPERAGLYRKSFRHYTEKTLLNSVVFYAACAMLFFGAFVMRYRLEMVLAFPVIALLMAEYFNLSFEPESAVQNPEKLFKERRLMIWLALCVALLALLLFLNVPFVGRMFPRSGTH